MVFDHLLAAHRLRRIADEIEREPAALSGDSVLDREIVSLVAHAVVNLRLRAIELERRR